MTLVSLFASVALALAVVGIYAFSPAVAVAWGAPPHERP